MQNDQLHKEIDLIQSCINRMASNSFHIKGWAIGLIAIIISFSPKQSKELPLHILMAAVTIMFWTLNAYFLKHERQYRKLYEWVIIERLKGNTKKMYSLDDSRFSHQVKGICGTMFSITLTPLYGTLLVLIVSLYLFNL